MNWVLSFFFFLFAFNYFLFPQSKLIGQFYDKQFFFKFFCNENVRNWNQNSCYKKYRQTDDLLFQKIKLNLLFETETMIKNKKGFDLYIYIYIIQMFKILEEG